MEVVSTCLLRDLPVYRAACESLRRNMPGATLHLITRRQAFAAFRDACGSDLILWDEDELVPNMTIENLRQYPLPFFPAGAGWYFQQFLKWGFARVSNEAPHYLIWDADTVLLRPLDFFDSEGRTYLTRASEFHRPYFETFKNLVGDSPCEQVSFISQHQLVNKAVLNELLDLINDKSESGKGWAWAIVENLAGQGSNLFSEYETYGHYLRLRHPDLAVTRELSWTRMGRKEAGYPPKADKLAALGGRYDYAAFESNYSLRGFFVHWLRKFLNWY
jgi:hypothetical protein